MKKPLLIVVAGPNGSGKTTLTNLLIRHEWGRNCEYINPDEIAGKMRGDPYSPETALRAAKLATEMRYEFLKKRIDFMFETVFSTEEKALFVRKALQQGYFVRFFFVCTDNPLINVKRVATRVINGGHDVPIRKIISRYYRSIYYAGLVVCETNRAYFYDNSVDGRQPELLFRFFDGRLKHYRVPEELPGWAGVFHGRLSVGISNSTFKEEVELLKNEQLHGGIKP